MSTSASIWAWSQSGITPKAKLLLLALADGVSESGAYRPNQAALQRMTSLTVLSINKALWELEKKGRIEVVSASTIRLLMQGE